MNASDQSESSIHYIRNDLTHLPVGVKGETGHTVSVNVSQDGHRGQGVRVPHADIRILPDLTCGHLDLIRMQR